MERFTGYSQFCPVAMAAEIIAERWTPLVLRELLYGHTRFGELKRGVPLMSPTLLSQRLKQLQAAKLVTREKGADGIGWEYRLTQAGRELQPIIEAMGCWALRWRQHDQPKRNYDVTLLMWDIRRGINPAGIPAAPRQVSKFCFTDAASTRRLWWLVCDGGDIDLCHKDPGHEIDLQIETDVRTLTDVWMAQLGLDAALRDERIRLDGTRVQRDAFRHWFTLNKLTHMPPWPWPQPVQAGA